MRRAWLYVCNKGAASLSPKHIFYIVCSLMPFYTSTLDRCRRLVNRFFIRNAFGYFNTALTEFDGGGSLVFWHTGICPESNSISVVFDRLRTQFTYNFVVIAALQKWNKRFGQICRANQVCQRDLSQDETNKKSQLIKHHKSSRVNTVIFYEANYLETDNRFDMVAHLAVSTNITWLNGSFIYFAMHDAAMDTPHSELIGSNVQSHCNHCDDAGRPEIFKKWRGRERDSAAWNAKIHETWCNLTSIHGVTIIPFPFFSLFSFYLISLSLLFRSV